jgi:hypothetical protein
MRALLAVALLATTAHADTRSWGAAKGHLLGDTASVVSFDVAGAKASPVFAKSIAAVMTMSPSLKGMMSLAMSACGDPTQLVTDAVLVRGFKHHGVLVLGVNGLDDAKLSTCLAGITQRPLVHEPVGKLVRYWPKGRPEDDQPIYVAWLAKDVVAIGMDPAKPDDLLAMINGGPAKGPIAKLIGKTDTTATGWAASLTAEGRPNGGWGSGKLAKGVLAIDGHFIAESVKEATDLRTSAANEFATTGGKFPTVGKVLKQLKLGGSGAEITVTAAIAEGDLPAFLADLDHAF